MKLHAGLREDQLEEKPAARTGNSRYVMLHGVVQHDLYHAGQIAVLKKAIRISRQVTHGTDRGIMDDVSVVEIRPPRAEDHGRMAELAGQLGYPSTAADIAKRLAGMEGRRDHAVFVAQLASGEIAGWIGVFIYRCMEADWRAEISGLVVDERVRSQGIGTEVAGAGGRMGARTGMRCNRSALECDSGPGAWLLRAAGVRALQDAEIVSQRI